MSEKTDKEKMWDRLKHVPGITHDAGMFYAPYNPFQAQGRVIRNQTSGVEPIVEFDITKCKYEKD